MTIFSHAGIVISIVANFVSIMPGTLPSIQLTAIILAFPGMLISALKALPMLMLFAVAENAKICWMAAWSIGGALLIDATIFKPRQLFMEIKHDL